jgi:hypothetical protein
VHVLRIVSLSKQQRLLTRSERRFVVIVNRTIPVVELAFVSKKLSRYTCASRDHRWLLRLCSLLDRARSAGKIQGAVN